MNVRLGADGDIEEWLSTDEQLERPVLIRFPGPDADAERIASFLKPIRAAAATSHPHVQKIYAAGEVGGSAFAVAEWDGAVTIEDRLKAGETIPISEYLPNASGVAAGLAAFHAAGGIHGAIDPGAIHFSAAHPARLAGFGRRPVTTTAEEDTAALAVALRTAVTGSVSPSVLPSHVAEGIPGAVDEALAAAESGALDAGGLADALSAASLRPERKADGPWSVKPLLFFAVVVAIVLALSIVGFAIDVDPDSPFLYPANPSEQKESPPVSPPESATPPTEVAVPAVASVYDPLGDGTENDETIGALVDGDRETSWSTETYPDPLEQIKPGVGVVLETGASVGAVDVIGSPGVRFTISWGQVVADEPDAWERIGSGQLLTGALRVDVPEREAGYWLVWFTSLPRLPDGGYGATFDEILLLP